MKIPVYIVNAFTQDTFGGNPAAVCPLDDWLPDKVMQSIAAQHNISETAFFVLAHGTATLRWFTPTTEVELCGHGTLASGHIVLTKLTPQAHEITFSTKSGALSVKKKQPYEMALPRTLSTPCAIAAELVAAMGIKPRAAQEGANMMLIYDNQKEIAALAPDMALLKQWCAPLNVGVIATAPAPAHTSDSELDFVSRFFAPAHGIDEDPVTGSAHCQLVPYWAERLGKKALKAQQISKRGGALGLVLDGEKVLLSGACVDFSQGVIDLSKF